MPMEPTPEEYEEIKGLDIHPDTFDKATLKRVRSMGVPHNDIVDACSKGIPIEDYETARANVNDHTGAVEEALGYQDSYRDTMAHNAKFVATHQNETKLSGLLPKNDHDRAVRKLASHHLSLKNQTEFGGSYADTPWRRRANEWIINECGKLDPASKKAVSNQTHYNAGDILSADEYNGEVNNLIKHHRLNGLHTKTIKDYIAHKRSMNALINIGTSQYLPSEYTPDAYEED